MIRFYIKEIADYPGYWASDQGRIYSTKRGSLRPIKLQDDPKRGRLICRLSHKNKAKTFKVHHIIILTFGGPRLAEACRHLDGDYKNNPYTNLAWGTQLDNIEDRQRHGTQTRGQSHNSKLDRLDIILIRDCYYFMTDTVAELAKHFEVSTNTIYDIIKRKTWAWL